MKFVIDRATWRCGGPNIQGKGFTKLLNKEGYMCCLGQVAIQLGETKENLLQVGCPSNLTNIKESGEVSKLLLTFDKLKYCHDDSLFAKAAMNINDCDYISQDQREQSLTELFIVTRSSL